MNLPAFCIRRPAFTIVISLVMVIVGVIGFMNLPVRWIPDIKPPEVSISTYYPGANAKLVEQDVTKVIESSLSGIGGIESMKSNSRQGESSINITFKLGTNMNVAAEDVRGSIERIRSGLPRDILNPTVAKFESGGDAIMYLSFYDDRYTERELSDYIDKFVVPSLETTDGVGGIVMYGKEITAIRVSLDPAKMAGANVTVDEVTRLLQEQNSAVPSGQIRGNDRFYSIVTDSGLKTVEQFNDLIIRDNQNQVVRLKDIGNTKLAPESSDSAFRIIGKPAIALGVYTQSTANPLDVEKNIQKVFADLKRTLPAGMKSDVLFNQTDYIRASIKSVYESLFEAILFVWLVILIFLGNFRATLVPIITIPVCLISTFSILYFFGFSINTITLMAFVLAIGLVVDDAIVMLENISRHMEEGLSAFSAALKGSKEMIFPIIAMTLTLAAVYAPIAFTPGLLGVLFREFTFTLAGAVLISGVVALTLSPMMCARFLRQNTNESRYSEWFSAQLQRLQNFYHRMLRLILRKRRFVVMGLLVIGLFGYGMFKWLPSELAPAEDSNTLYAYIAAPRSSSFDYLNSYVKQLETIYNQNADIKSYFSSVGGDSVSHAFQMLTLKPSKDRKQSTADLVASLSSLANTITGVRINIFVPPPPLAEFAGSDSGDSIGMVIMTNQDYRELQKTTEKMVDLIREDKGFLHADNKLKWDGEQFQLNINRERAADLKVPITSITETISTLIASKRVGKVDDANVIVQMNQSALSNPNIYQQLYVRNLSGELIPLNNFASITESSAPELFSHYERLRSDTIFVTLAPNLKVSDAIKKLEKIAKANLPDGMKYTFTGEAKSFLESNGKTLFTFILALVFIYLVLVAQFESFIDPLIILFTVPFAMVGAMITLKLFGGTLNIYSNIGLITLVGLIAKHGILITEFANRERIAGKSIEEAVVSAALMRLRPILMTTAAMVLGAVPLAVAFGAGAETRQQIGLVITGGMLFGTFFSLIIVPITYTYLSPFRRLVTKEQE